MTLKVLSTLAGGAMLAAAALSPAAISPTEAGNQLPTAISGFDAVSYQQGDASITSGTVPSGSSAAKPIATPSAPTPKPSRRPMTAIAPGPLRKATSPPAIR